MIGIPSGITPVEKRAVVKAAIRARASEVHLVEQAMGAAVGADLPVTEPTGNMIVDIGGGRTDIAVVSLSGIVHVRSAPLAGNVMEDAILRHIRTRHNLLIGERTAESIKIGIGSADPLRSPLRTEAKSRNHRPGIVLSGGGALLRNLHVRIASESGLPVTVADNPTASVVLGAGRMLSDFRLLRKMSVN